MIAFLSFVVQHGIALASILLAAAAAGTALAGPRPPLVLRSILGLALLGQALVLLGTAGWIAPWTLVVLLAIAIVAGATRIEWRRPDIRALLFVALFLPLFALALYPPLAFDETLYHLPFVRAIATSGAIRLQPGLRFAMFPQLHEALCVPAFLAAGDAATHLVAVAEVMLLVGLMVAWLPRRAGVVAAALVFGNPILIGAGSVTYVDVALTLFVAAGFYCLDRARENDETWLVAASGFLLGTACSVKYLGGYFAVAALLVIAMTRRRSVPAFLLGLAGGALPMFALIVATTGNPVYPFFNQGTASGLPIGTAHPIVRALRLFWDVTFAREHVNQQPPYSPLFAVSVLITILAARRDRRAAFLCALGGVYVALFVTSMSPDSRYLLPLLPLVSVIAAPVLARRTSIAVLVSIASVAAGIAYAGYRLRILGPVPVDEGSRRAFLERRVPEMRALAHKGPGRVYVCGAEQLQYYGNGEMVGDVVGPLANDRVLGGRDAAGLARVLAPLGVRSVLMSRRACPPEWQRIPAPPYFERAYADAGAVLWRVPGP